MLSLSQSMAAVLHSVSGAKHKATAWRMFWVNGSGKFAEIALGASGTYLMGAGTTTAPAFGSETASETGRTVQIIPWAGSTAQSNWSTITQSSSRLGAGYLQDSSAGSTSKTVSWDRWLSAGTAKFAVIFDQDTNKAILTVKFNGSSIGTVDMYSGAGSNNFYSEITGITVSAAVTTIQLSTPTKNGSSSNYGAFVESLAVIRTGA